MNCPKCNAPNKPSASYCLQCGFRLASTSPGGSTAVPEPVAHRQIGLDGVDPGRVDADAGASGRSDGRKKTMVMGPGTNPLADAAPRKTQVLTPEKRGVAPKPTPVEVPPAGERRPAARTAYFAPNQNPLSKKSVPEGSATLAPRPERRKLRGWVASSDFDPLGQSWELGEGRNFLGREASDCAVVLDRDPTVSRKHAVIMIRPSQVYVRDQDSEYGTRVNGQEIGMESQELHDGDTVTICGYTLTIKLL